MPNPESKAQTITVECPMCEAMVQATVSPKGDTASIKAHTRYDAKSQPVKCSGGNCTVMV